jgi:hypothetical protein
MSNPILEARGTGDTCMKCRRKFQPGDRMQPAYIVTGHGRDPANPRQPGLLIGPEFEMVHVVCEDPQLAGQVIIRSNA